MDPIDPRPGAVTTVHQNPGIRPARGYFLRDRSPRPAELHLTKKKRSGGALYPMKPHIGGLLQARIPPKAPPVHPQAKVSYPQLPTRAVLAPPSPPPPSH